MSAVTSPSSSTACMMASSRPMPSPISSSSSPASSSSRSGTSSHSSTDSSSRRSNSSSLQSSGASAYAADFFSSWTAVALTIPVAHPVDTIRIRRQTEGLTARQTIGRHGFRSLYNGVSTPLLTTGPSIANAFALNDMYKGLVASGQQLDSPKDLSLGSLALAGALAGATSSLFLCPVAVVRINQQTAVLNGMKETPSFQSLAGGVWRTQGLRGLYRGLPSEALQAAMGRLVYFTTYEKAKGGLQQYGDRANVPVFAVSVAAAILSSWLTWSVTYPLDVVKNKVQSDAAAGLQGGQAKYRGLLHCASVTYRELGLRGFWAGLPATLARGVVSSGITLPGYDLLRPHFREAFCGTQA